MKTISISTLEGLLEADYFEGGPHWVLLCHGKVFSKGDWGELPNQLNTDDQRSVLSLNFSGYGPRSEIRIQRFIQGTLMRPYYGSRSSNRRLFQYWARRWER